MAEEVVTPFTWRKSSPRNGHGVNFYTLKSGWFLWSTKHFWSFANKIALQRSPKEKRPAWSQIGGIPNWSEKKFCAHLRKRAVMVLAKQLQWGLKKSVNNAFFKSIWDLRASRDLDYTGQAVWSHFIFSVSAAKLLWSSRNFASASELNISLCS